MTIPVYCIGLTGGIGSGKSAVSGRFAAHGITIVDTDQIARALTQPGGKAMRAIRETFGDSVIDAAGRLNRVAMREKIFADTRLKQQLESILHPLIRDESNRQCLAATSPYVIMDVPLLAESEPFRRRCHRICVVDCPEALQIARVMQRNGLSEQQVRAIIAHQATRQTRLGMADDVIDNQSSLSHLEAQVDLLHQKYLSLAVQNTAP